MHECVRKREESKEEVKENPKLQASKVQRYRKSVCVRKRENQRQRETQ